MAGRWEMELEEGLGGDEVERYRVRSASPGHRSLAGSRRSVGF